MAAAPAPHPAVSAVAVVKIDPSGTLTLTLTHDALAFACNERPDRIADEPMLALLAAPEPEQAAALADARERFAAQTHIKASGQDIRFDLTASPTTANLAEWKRTHPTYTLPLKLDFVSRATLAPNTATLSLQFPQALGDVILILDRPGAEPLTIPLGPGEASPPVPPSPSGGGGRPWRPEGATSSTSPTPTPSSSALSTARRFAVRGFTHIIPQGTDHALFILGLFLLTPRPRTLLWPITTFTLAHTLTLTLCALRLVSVPRGVVEPAIAATIAFIAIENCFTLRVRAWRPAVAFLFGLIHGLGVASDFAATPIPTRQLVAAVLAFNVGVEGGHIATLLAAYALLGWTASKPWYRRRVAIPLSIAIAALALFWLIQRLT